MLGHIDYHPRLTPARVGQEGFSGAKIVTADCGTFLSASVSENGGFFPW